MQYNIVPLKKDLVAIRDQLKELGDVGWELVTIVLQPDAYKPTGTSDLSSFLAYFKKSN